ncbi:gamma-glutamylcyclotransferase family protein [Luteolibacter marinus]|uniref:gamma-glutamylcyclotransferase family protein n=1 Tax=Luteolibacter marinus TaxID=2776705 RepID=UPI00186831F0|nr:gamma-glutamylcyclotransferase family protein [Luteolibacter marinus]
MTKSDNGSELVFVYGTLRRGGSNAFRMEGAEFVGEGFVRGYLYAISWYPGLVLDEGAGKVRGDVFKVGPKLLRELDEFEGLSAGELQGGEYRRLKSEVLLGPGESCSAWVFEWVAAVEPMKVIPSGDWLHFGASERVPWFTILTALPLVGAGACLGIRMPALEGILGQEVIRVLTLFFLISSPAIGLMSAWIAERRREQMRWLRMTFSFLSCLILIFLFGFLSQHVA